jgi:hypothetical protein
VFLELIYQVSQELNVHLPNALGDDNRPPVCGRGRFWQSPT